ncbi:hypothetical protein M406DRAFT_338683 [Cryphonectria parasitica EP155]|uniref:Rhodopsin domain-containing protein n=1 Tax=Cryphonectria parasitica (strain ATCC 38755 / EP155) TaxID=660469 RepID=A0A9P5CRY7_CRYP1|nr:uncharacterized protein M406DRAFT_338683 [Cryphonectria parasitica EP155]KAF3768032.1 hypothetical protein M406DRAFT_338683 [Cryphonectria parasitica EP155]
MTLYSEAPDQLPWTSVKPTVLVCWWATLFSTIIILLRVTGRFVRSEMLFTEDKMAFFCLIPLYVRMGLVHAILLYGTNNVQVSGLLFSTDELWRRKIGSGLVLASRIFYAATLWMLKNTILEFFKRLTGLTWSKAYQSSVVAIRCVLIATFVAVLISDLAECRPFSHYWQVFPDPGGQCRQGYANLFTIGVCNVLTDLLLVVLPIPIILQSQMALTRKIQLILLFSMSLLPVIVTLYRLSRVIDDHGGQQLRSLLASIELLVATGVANALVLGSFVRDRGVKKRRFKYGSVADESAHGTDSDNRSRRPTVAERAWGSDEDLFRDIGFGVHSDLRDIADIEALPARPILPAKHFNNMRDWNFPEHAAGDDRTRHGSLPLSDAPSSSGPKKVSFFDVGGLLDDESSGSPSTVRRQSTISSKGPATTTPPPSVLPAGASGFRRGSQAFLQDLGGLLGPFRSSSRDSGDSATELREFSPAVSPKTEFPPQLSPGAEEEEEEEEEAQKEDHYGSSQQQQQHKQQPPPYEGYGRPSEDVGGVVSPS